MVLFSNSQSRAVICISFTTKCLTSRMLTIKARPWTTVNNNSGYFQRRVWSVSGLIKTCTGQQRVWQPPLSWDEKTLTTRVKISQRTQRRPIPLLSILSDMHTCLCLRFEVLHPYKLHASHIQRQILVLFHYGNWWQRRTRNDGGKDAGNEEGWQTSLCMSGYQWTIMSG